MVWQKGELVLKGEPAEIEFQRIGDPAKYLTRLDPCSPVPPPPVRAEPVESRLCAPGAVELPREAGLYLARTGDACAVALRGSLGLVCATDGETVFSFCADLATGAPRPGAEVGLLARGKVLLSGSADDQGLFEAALGGALTVLARDGDDLAFALLRGLPPAAPAPVGIAALPGGAVSEGLPLRLFGFIPREAGKLFPAGASGFGKTLLRADAMGAFVGSLQAVRVRPGTHALRIAAHSVEFDVARKKESDFELRIAAPGRAAPGDEVRAEVTAREPFGEAVECAFSYSVVEERLGRGRRLTARGSSEGKGRFSFTLPARAAGVYRVAVEARAKRDGRSAAEEKLIRCGRGLALQAEPLYARPGEEVQALVSNAVGKVMLISSGRARDIGLDADGCARAALRFEQAGIHEVRALSGGEVARAEVRVCPTGTETLSLTPAHRRARPGSEARVLVEGAAHSALVLCASSRRWWTRVVRLAEGRAEVRFPVLDAFGPAVELHALAFRRGKVERASCTLRVERAFSLTIRVRERKAHLQALDEDGTPVSASFVALVREAGQDLPVPLGALVPVFPAHIECASSLDFASAGGTVTWKKRTAPRGRASPGPPLPSRAPEPLRVEGVVRLGPAAEASFSIPPRETRAEREIVAYAFGEGGRCSVARAPLAEEEAWGRVLAPGYLVEDDELWAELRLWNDSPDGVETAAGVRGEKLQVDPPGPVRLSAGESLSVPFLVRAGEPGDCAISSAFGRRELAVLAHGRPEEVSRSGVLEEDVSLDLPLPGAARGPWLSLSFAPTAADAVAQARRGEAEDLPRLYARGDESGGYAWHGSAPDALSTALAALRLKGLLPDSASMLSRTLDALAPLARAEGTEWRRAFAAHVLARCGRDPGRVSASSPLALAYGALAEEERRRHGRAVELCRRLEAMAAQGPAGVHWGRKRARSEAGSKALPTAAALRALLRVRPASRLIPGACRFLLTSRKALSWGGGLADREALAALEEHARSRPKEEVAGLTVAASEAGLTRVTVRAAGKTLSKAILWREELPGGGPIGCAIGPARRIRIELSKEGPGKIPFSAWIEYRGGRPGGGLRVERRYSRLRLRRGETVECVLHVRARGALERVVVRDFIPAGFEVVKAPGAELKPPEIAFSIARLEGEAVLRYALRARFRGRFTALAPMVEIEGTDLRGRGREHKLEVGY